MEKLKPFWNPGPIYNLYTCSKNGDEKWGPGGRSLHFPMLDSSSGRNNTQVSALQDGDLN